MSLNQNNRIMSWWTITLTILHSLTYPFIVLSHWLLVLLSFLTAPLVHLGHYAVQAFLLPFKIIAKFEVSFTPCTAQRNPYTQLLHLDSLHILRRRCPNRSHHRNLPTLLLPSRRPALQSKPCTSAKTQEAHRSYCCLLSCCAREEAAGTAL
jgi:hypothetical protein